MELFWRLVDASKSIEEISDRCQRFEWLQHDTQDQFDLIESMKDEEKVSSIDIEIPSILSNKGKENVRDENEESMIHCSNKDLTDRQNVQADIVDQIDWLNTNTVNLMKIDTMMMNDKMIVDKIDLQLKNFFVLVIRMNEDEESVTNEWLEDDQVALDRTKHVSIVAFVCFHLNLWKMFDKVQYEQKISNQYREEMNGW